MHNVAKTLVNAAWGDQSDLACAFLTTTPSLKELAAPHAPSTLSSRNAIIPLCVYPLRPSASTVYGRDKAVSLDVIKSA